MSTFSSIRAEVGLDVDEVASGFNLPLAMVQEWEAGKEAPPVHVVRTLEVLRSFASLPPPPTAFSSSDIGAATRYPQKSEKLAAQPLDRRRRGRHNSRPMRVDFYGPEMGAFSGAVEPRLPLPPREIRRRPGESNRPRLLDLFCCAGGAGVGYHRAGFDVVGVDIVPRPNYPFDFREADAMKLDPEFIASFDAVHASPPCQSYSDLAKRNGNGHEWPRLIEPVREMLIASGRPYVIENVEGSPLLDPVVLCGTMFPRLRVIRHRLFEANFKIVPPPHKRHPKVHTFDKRKSHFGKTNEWTDFVQVTGGGNCTLAAARDAMGIEWMTKGEINEAIPPAYTELIGGQLMEHLKAAGVNADNVLDAARA